MKEADLYKQMIDAASYLGFRLQRINSGKIRVGKRWVHLAKEGTPDLIGYSITGKYTAIEVKLPGEKLRPEQQDYLRDVELRGGIGICVSSVEGLIENLKKRRV
jgi:hypothetical protein